MGKLGRFIGETILLYILVFVGFSLHDHRFAFSWFPVILTLVISLPVELIQLLGSANGHWLTPVDPY